METTLRGAGLLGASYFMGGRNRATPLLRITWTLMSICKTHPENTMDNPHKDLALHALDQLRSDDLARARRAFAKHTPEQMQQEYGESGKTCAEILADYESFNEEINAAIAWVQAQA